MNQLEHMAGVCDKVRESLKSHDPPTPGMCASPNDMQAAADELLARCQDRKSRQLLSSERSTRIADRIRHYRNTLHRRRWWLILFNTEPTEDERRGYGIAFADGMAAQRDIDRQMSGERK